MIRCRTRLILMLGLADENYPYSDVVRDDSPITSQAVSDALVAADLETRELIVSTLNHSFRNQFITEKTAALSHRSKIPAFIGSHGLVTIENSVKSSVYTGKLAKNLDAVERARRNTPVYGEAADLYFIENGVIYLGSDNSAAYIEMPLLNVDRAANSGKGALFSPVNYENGVIAAAAPKLFLRDQDTQERGFYLSQAMDFFARIRGNRQTLPDVEAFKKS